MENSCRNLVNSFPDKSQAELKRIEKSFYQNLCDVIVEACKLLIMKPDELKKPFRAFPFPDGWQHFRGGVLFPYSFGQLDSVPKKNVGRKGGYAHR